MPLILVVDPNRQQAARVAAVLRRRARTEVVIAESATGALDAVAARVPDVLLTSPLLSEREESVLADWLRGLGAAAAHVQVLTIPILATAAPADTTRGMLSVLRRRRPRKTSVGGCEPAVFADQVGLYLERASDEREVWPVPTLPPEPPPATVEGDPPEPAVAVIETDAPNQIEGVNALAPLPADEDARWEPVPLDEMHDAPVRLPEPADAEGGTDEVWLLTPILEIEELVVAPPEDPREPPAALPERADVETGTDHTWMLTPGPEELVVAPPDIPPEIATFVLLTPIYDLPPDPVQVFVAAPVARIDAPPPEVVAASPPVTTRRRKSDKPKKKPVQDEWGFFDPSQCGFAALLDKLDEITAAETAADTRDEATVRVISY